MKEIDAILSLVHPEAALVHGNSPEEGGDFDCVAPAAAQRWPLRLPASWRLIQDVPYDATGRQYVFAVHEEVIALDLLVDPHGIGKYGFKTASMPTPADVAAYRVLKRLFKRDLGVDAWSSIGGDVGESELAHALEPALGSLSIPLASAVHAAAPPSAELARRARTRVVRRRLRPDRAARVAVRAVRRVTDRVLRPRGLTVAVAGPDGTGKSAVTAALKTGFPLAFRAVDIHHLRPRLLPRPGAVARRPARDSSSPHSAEPHGRLLSAALVFYAWLDALLGELVYVWPARIRNRLVVVERGWDDLGIDPRRYRLASVGRLVEVLGALQRRPDLTIVLVASPEIVTARKSELREEEIERQTRSWLARPGAWAVDAEADPADVVASVRTAVLDLAARRTARRLDAGWLALPSRRHPRWIVPRGSRCLTAGGLSVYQPVTRRSRVGWRVARAAALAGMARCLPRAQAPDAVIASHLSPFIPPRGCFALSRSIHPNRWTALVLDAKGGGVAVAKVATDESGRRTLEREEAAIARLGERLAPPLRAPGVIASAPGLLVLDHVDHVRQTRPTHLSTDVAHALGKLFRETGEAHGDVAPWNLLYGPDGTVTLVDWESAGPARPFADLFHFLQRSSDHLGAPVGREIEAGLAGDGWIGDAVRAYAAGASVDPTLAAAAWRATGTPPNVSDLAVEA